LPRRLSRFDGSHGPWRRNAPRTSCPWRMQAYRLVRHNGRGRVSGREHNHPGCAVECLANRAGIGVAEWGEGYRTGTQLVYPEA
jgi:hypothetical protein